MERRVAASKVPWLGRPLEVGRYGHYGRPVVFFPTGGADWRDCERFLMVEALAPLIEAGRIKLYSVDAVNKDAWTNAEVPPPTKSWLQAQYSTWLADWLAPFVRADCGGWDGGIVVTGASLGAFQAFNAVARNPGVYTLGIGMSGTYVLDRRMGSHRDDNYYFNQPVQFLPGLRGPLLDGLRTSYFHFALGRGPAENPDYTWRAARALGERGIPNYVETWDPPADHDWPTWRAMLPALLDRFV